MTDSDLRDARAAVDDRIDSTRQRDRRRTGLAATAAAVVVAVAGVTAFQALGGDEEPARPAGPGPTTTDPDADFLTGNAPTPPLVAGVWRVDNGVTLVRFDEDGTVRFDEHGKLFSDPVTTGTYEIDGDLIFVTTTDDAQFECIGETFAMRASLPEPGAMRFVRSDPSFSACAPVPAGRQVLEQVLPTSRSLAALVFSTERGWQDLSSKAGLPGVWLAQGGGHVLEIDPSGTYYVADESGAPVDRGHWSLLGSDLTLTSSAGSAECSDGDQMVLGAVEQVDPETTCMRGTVEQNTCGGAWTPAAWILIPHVGS